MWLISVLQYGYKFGIIYNMKKIIKNNSIYKKAKHNGVFGSVELFDMINSNEIDDLINQCNRNIGKEIYPDAILTRLIEEKGFNARPILLDKRNYTMLITSKLTHIYRGVCYKNALKDFVYNDKMFVGKGIYCNGIYFAYGEYGRKTAELYMASRKPNLFQKGWRDGVVFDAYMAQNTKIINFRDLVVLRNKMVNVADKYNNLSSKAKSKLIEILSNDISKCAVLCGYDAININHGKQEYMVILNRGKLIMQKPKGKEKINER